MALAHFVWPYLGSPVSIAGSWNNWIPQEMKESSVGYVLDLDLPIGTYQYKFVVNGLWLSATYLPSSPDGKGNKNNVITIDASSIPHTGLPQTKHERTFIAIKPDGVQRGIVGEIIKRFEQKGYKLVAMKLVHPHEEFAKAHYDSLKTIRPLYL